MRLDVIKTAALCAALAIGTLWVSADVRGAKAPKGFQTKAKHAVLMDADADLVLYEKDADTPMPPASMSKLMTLAVVFRELKAGNIKLEDEFEVFTPLQSFDLVRKALDENKVAYTRASLTRIPQNSVPVEGKVAEQLVRLLEALEDQDDVQNVYANFEMDENELAELTA